MIRVIKIGGNVINNPKKLTDFLKKFSKIEGAKILVHGGGIMATKLAEKLSVETQMIEGKRVTSKEMLDVAVMVYGGLVNKKIVAELQSFGQNSVGLTGADGNLIQSKKKAPVNGIDYGFVGEILKNKVNNSFIFSLLDQNITPICCALTHDGKGQILNTNADAIAAGIAKSIAKEKDVSLTYCFEKKGVLLDVEDESSVINQIDKELFRKLKEEGKIHSGMIPKLENAIKTLESKVSSVYICNSNDVNTPESGTKMIL